MLQDEDTMAIISATDVTEVMWLIQERNLAGVIIIEICHQNQF